MYYCKVSTLTVDCNGSDFIVQFVRELVKVCLPSLHTIIIYCKSFPPLETFDSLFQYNNFPDLSCIKLICNSEVSVVNGVCYLINKESADKILTLEFEKIGGCHSIFYDPKTNCFASCTYEDKVFTLIEKAPFSTVDLDASIIKVIYILEY